MKKKSILGAIGGVAAIAITLVALPASAAVPGESVPANTIAIPLTRVVNTPGIALTTAQPTVQVAVAGQKGIPAAAVAVTGRLVAYDTTGENLVEWDGFSGAPGDPTVVSGAADASGASQAFNSALHNGDLSVHLLRGSGHFLLEVTGYELPAPPVAAATTFGVGQVVVDRHDGAAGASNPVVWAQYSAAELGSPIGDQASGTFRFTCKNATVGCDVSMRAYSTATGYTVYPRLDVQKDTTDPTKKYCEYADGINNEVGPETGFSSALSSTATAITLGVGGSFDCGGSQTGSPADGVASFNVPGANDGVGIHYDVAVSLTFMKSGS